MSLITGTNLFFLTTTLIFAFLLISWSWSKRDSTNLAVRSSFFGMFIWSSILTANALGYLAHR